MKTRELIAELQKADPSGELEVSVGKTPIYFVERKPANYDGHLQMLIQDPAKAPHWNIAGLKVTDRGEHLSIRPMDLDDCLIDHPELPVDLSELNDSRRAGWEERVEKARAEVRAIDAEIAADKAKESAK